MEALSVLILTRNEADRLPDCLASVAFADEVLVVDSQSSDGTPTIGEKAGARVLSRPFTDHADQKNWGLARLTHRWVLIVDADERVPPELATEIRGLLDRPDRKDGYWIRRSSVFMGRRIRGCGWQRERVLRFFDRERGRYLPRLVHEEVEVRGSVGTLTARLDHRPYRNLSEWIERSTRYAHLGANELHRRERPFRRRDLVIRPVLRFFKQWIVQGGWRDGGEGFVLCAVSAYGVLVKYARLHELERESK